MENFNGIMVATTNFMEGIDQAALRRFDLKLQFDYLQPAQAWCWFLIKLMELGLTPSDAHLRTQVEDMNTLTPGDFAAVIRQHQFLPIHTAEELLAALQHECAMKEGGRRQSIGFLR